MSNYHYVYKVTFNLTNEYYIGKHSSILESDNYRGSGVVLKEKISNDEPFTFEILKYYDSSKEAYEGEKTLISDLWKNDPLCLNKVPGGKGGFEHIDWKGIPKSEEHKRKIGEGNKKPRTGQAYLNVVAAGKLGAQARRGQKDSIEVRQKRAESLSKATKGKPKLYLRKKYIIEGVEYLGLEDIVKKYNVSRQTVINRIKDNRWSEWNNA